MFDTIHACISDKLTRRNHATTVTCMPALPSDARRAAMIVSNKCSESVQYDMLQAFNDA